MRKIHGKIGYATETETYPGVWEETIIERDYYGELVKNRANIERNNSANGNITFASNISIIADQYVTRYFHNIRYVTYLGTKWSVTSIEPDYPRMLLSIGSVYNG